MRVLQRLLLGSQVLGETPSSGGVPELKAAGRLLADHPGFEEAPSFFAGGAPPQDGVVELGGELVRVGAAAAGDGEVLLLCAHHLVLLPRPLPAEHEGGALCALIVI